MLPHLCHYVNRRSSIWTCHFYILLSLKTGRASGINLKMVLLPLPDISWFLRFFPVHCGNVSVSHDLHHQKNYNQIRCTTKQISLKISFVDQIQYCCWKRPLNRLRVGIQDFTFNQNAITDIRKAQLNWINREEEYKISFLIKLQSLISEKGNWIWIDPEEEYHNQVWGRDIVPGRSHVNSSGRSFCILSSCIFTAHNPTTKNYFLSRTITTLQICRVCANI